MPDITYDAIVVGSGIAGSLSAALPIGIDRPAGRL